VTDETLDLSGPGPRLQMASLGVAVIGAGRVGVEVIRGLQRLGIGRIDAYEIDPGVAAAVPPGVAVHAGDFWDQLTLARLREYDFAVCTVDDAGAQTKLNQKCLVANVNLMLVATDGGLARVAAYPFAQLDSCACHECPTPSGAQPLPIASMKLSVHDGDDRPARAPVPKVDAATVAGGLAAALVARVVAGVGGFVPRRATFDAALGEGSSLEIERDPGCGRCGGLERPVPIVHTRNRWGVPAHVAAACPEALEHDLELSEDIEGMVGRSFRLAELAERFKDGPIPAKFALTVVDGRPVCLDFEEVRPPSPPAQSTR
jgi:hypothetical protein